MPTYPDLRDCTILITGGANGIGAAMVRAFIEQGSRVAFCDVDTAAGRSLAAEHGPNAIFHRVDLRQESQISSWISAIRKRFGPIHVLINNAAADPRIKVGEMSAAQWDDLFARNMRAYFLTVREANPWMPEGSSIINFASIVFHTGPIPLSAYVATKAAAVGFTRSLARELGPRRIRVNTISPGWIMTERQLKQYVTPATKRLIRSSQCIPDLNQPSEIAEVALFLASDVSRIITGQEILADRGWAHS